MCDTWPWSRWMTAQRVGRDHGQLVIGQVDDLVGVAGQGRGVAGHEVLAVAHAHDQRAAAAARRSSRRDNRGTGPPGRRCLAAAPARAARPRPAADALARWCRQIAGSAPCDPCSWLPGRLLIQATGDQVGDDFAVGGRAEHVAFALPAAVLSARKFSITPLCTTATPPSPPRCGWALSSVAGPCVAQRVWPMPIVAGRRRFVQRLRQVVDATGSLGHQQGAVIDRGDARAVVAAILQPPQAFEQIGRGVAWTDVANDSAHESRLRLASLLHFERQPASAIESPRFQALTTERWSINPSICGRSGHRQPGVGCGCRLRRRAMPIVPAIGRWHASWSNRSFRRRHPSATSLAAVAPASDSDSGGHDVSSCPPPSHSLDQLRRDSRPAGLHSPAAQAAVGRDGQAAVAAHVRGGAEGPAPRSRVRGRRPRGNRRRLCEPSAAKCG